MDNPKKNDDYLVIYEARATKSKIGFNYYSKSVRIMSFVDNEWHTPTFTNYYYIIYLVRYQWKEYIIWNR